MSTLAQDPVHMDPDGQWYFYNQAGDGRYGPWPTPEMARAKFGEFVAWCNSQRAPEPTAAPTQSQLEQAVSEYLAQRDLKSSIAARHKQELEEIEAQMAKSESFLQGALIDLGVDSFKVASGTVFTQPRLMASIGDKNALMEHIRKSGDVELLQSRVSTTVLKDWMDRNQGHCPPGVTASFERVVSVRRK